MTKKFDDFVAAAKVALARLCVEHEVCLRGDCGETYVWDLLDTDDALESALVDLRFGDLTTPTPEEREADEAARAAQSREWERLRAEQRAADEVRYAAHLQSKDYLALQDAVVAHAMEIRSTQMRVSTDPTDPAYIDARPRRVWVGEREIHGWITADEFRRCVVTAAGVINGAVMIERLPEPGAPVVKAPAECTGGLSGVCVKVEDEPVAAPAPSFAVPTVPVKAVAKPAAMKAAARKKGRK